MIVKTKHGLKLIPISKIFLNEAKQLIIDTPTDVTIELMSDEVKDVLRAIMKHCKVALCPNDVKKEK